MNNKFCNVNAIQLKKHAHTKAHACILFLLTCRHSTRVHAESLTQEVQLGLAPGNLISYGRRKN
jgi:hypothetical protein